jgi:hypothetical protein
MRRPYFCVLSLADDAVKQLKRYYRNTLDLLKKKFRQCAMQQGRLFPLLLSLNGVDAFFPNQATIDMFVHSFMECVSDFFFNPIML